MKKRNSFLIYQFALIFSIYFAGCTKNPFDNDKIKLEGNEISGTVTLSNELIPEGIYVWLENFNIGTYTNQKGEFSLKLSPEISQGSSGGVNGAFNLYFYAANYELEKAKVYIQNGRFMYAEGDINKNGKLKSPAYLSQLLDIRTEVLPNSVSQDATGLIRAQITLECTTLSVLSIYFPSTANGYLAPLLFQNTITNEVYIKETTPAGIPSDNTISLSNMATYERELWINIGRGGQLPLGTYKIFPYLLLKNQNIPTELIQSLGTNVENLSKNYVAVPFIRRDGRLTIFSD